MKRLFGFFSLLPALIFAQVWIARYNGTPNENPDDEAHGIVLDTQGNVYVTGWSPIDYHVNYNYATIKYNRDGVEQWVAKYNGPGDSTDKARAIGIDALENIYVTGYSWGGTTTDNDFATIKYNSQGDTIWTARYDGPANNDDQAYAMAVSPQGDIYVTGYCTGISTYWDYCIIRYNSQGETIWTARYNGPGNSNDVALAIAVDSFGNCYVTGSSPNYNSNYDIVTIKYNPAGETVWVARYNGPGNDYDGGVSIAVNSSCEVWVTGSSMGTDTSYDWVTIRYNSDGSEHWVKRYNGPAGRDDRTNALSIDAADNVYVTGSITAANSYTDCLTIKYDSEGNEQWITQYNGPDNNNDVTNTIQLDQMGNVYVCGYSQTTAALKDFLTIKYNPLGETCWVTSYNSSISADDLAFDLTTDDSGYVYVTGYSYWVGSWRDYLTIKYYPGGYTNLYEINGKKILDKKIEVFPNPARHSVYVSYLLPVQVFTVSGRLVTTLKPGANNISNLAQGIYLIQTRVNNFTKLVVLKSDH